MLAAYDQNQANWKSKDVALYLVTSLASKGQTQKHGVTQSSQLVNLEEFAGKHILPELAKDDGNEISVVQFLLLFSTNSFYLFKPAIALDFIHGEIISYQSKAANIFSAYYSQQQSMSKPLLILAQYSQNNCPIFCENSIKRKCLPKILLKRVNSQKISLNTINENDSTPTSQN